MSAHYQLPFAMTDSYERARSYRREIGRLLDEARSGHVDLRGNASAICAAARGLEAVELCIAVDLAARLTPTTGRRRRVKRPRSVPVTKFPEGEL